MGRLLSNRAAIPRTQRPGFLAGGRSEGAKGTEHSQEERRNGGFSLPYVSQLGAICVPARQTSAFGLLESTYMPCLQFELATAGLRFVTQRAVPILYKGIELDANYRIDLLVENFVVVEIKAIEQLIPVHQAQVLTYMRLLGCPAGLLINFNVPKLSDGVRRLMNPRADGGECHAGGAGPVGPARG